MKTWKIFWGVAFILVAVALILNALGVLASITSPFGEVSVFALAAGLLLLSHTVVQLVKGRIGDIFIPLSLIFMLFEKNIAHVMSLDKEDIINNWLLFGCACLLSLGFSILFSGFKKKKRHFKLVHTFNDDDDDDDDDHCEIHHSEGNLGSTVKYINCDGFKYESIENNLGSFNVFFENVDKYEGGGVLEIENNLGSMTINVPSSWRIDMKIENSLGGFKKPNDDGADGPTLKIRGENNLGGVTVKYV